MRTIYATGGYSDALTVDVAGADLNGATYKVALAPETQATPPAAASSAWKVPDLDAGIVSAELRLLLNADTTPGHYGAWLQVTIGGRVVPVRILDDEGHPLLVHVV